MAIARVQISEDKAELVKALRSKEDGRGLFATYADVLMFAAVLGYRHRKRSALGKFSRKDPDAVLQDQFKNASIINLIAIAETHDPNILADDEESDRAKVQIFQEYANGGLEILKRELQGVENYLERILLILYADKNKQDDKLEDFDLANFL